MENDLSNTNLFVAIQMNPKSRKWNRACPQIAIGLQERLNMVLNTGKCSRCLTLPLCYCDPHNATLDDLRATLYNDGDHTVHSDDHFCRV